MNGTKGLYFNLDPLTIDYIPNETLYRSNELDKIEKMFLSSFKMKLSPNLVIYGSRGSGKTLLAKKLLERLKTNDIEGVFIDCSSCVSEYEILIKVVKSLNLVRRSIRGISLEELLSYILGYTLRKDYPTVFVFDNIDRAVDYKNSFILNSLFRIGENFEKLNGKIGILITVDEDSFEKLRENIKDFMRIPSIKLEKYTEDQLYGILKNRAEKSLYQHAYSEEVLRKISKISAKTGDAKLAIFLLFHSVLESERLNEREIREEILDALIKRSNFYLIEENSASKLEREVIEVLRKISKDNKCSMKLRELWDFYKNETERQNKKPMSYTSFWKTILILEKKGILKREVKSLGRYGRSTIIDIK